MSSSDQQLAGNKPPGVLRFRIGEKFVGRSGFDHAAAVRQTIEDLWVEYRDELAAMNIGPFQRIMTLIWDARFSLLTALLAGFGRAAAEVGAVIIVGGNIDGFTRTMTTAIALETSKGDLPLAIGLGIVLIAIVILVNALAWTVRRAGERLAG